MAGQHTDAEEDTSFVTVTGPRATEIMSATAAAPNCQKGRDCDDYDVPHIGSTRRMKAIPAKERGDAGGGRVLIRLFDGELYGFVLLCPVSPCLFSSRGSDLTSHPWQGPTDIGILP
jgi:hypothetical protein